MQVYKALLDGAVEVAVKVLHQLDVPGHEMATFAKEVGRCCGAACPGGLTIG